MGGLKGLVARLFQVMIQSDNIVYAVYPIQAANKKSDGLGILSDAGVDTWGAYIPLIAAALIGTEYWYVGTQLHEVGAATDDVGVQACYTDGAGPPPLLIRLLDEIEWQKFTVVDQDLGCSYCGVPYPVRLPANAELSYRSATLNAGAKTVTVSCKVATGL